MVRVLYNEFFYIPKDGKIREKVMLARAVGTLVVIPYSIEYFYQYHHKILQL